MPPKITAFISELPKVVLRIAVGTVFLYHGIMKVLNGIEGFATYIRALGIPFSPIISYLVVTAEFFGGLMLIAGFYARWATLPLIATMIVAIVKVTGKYGFNVFDKGYEYNMILIACLVAILIQGSGKWSVRN